MDGSQKEEGNFLNLLQKEEGTQNEEGGGGFPRKRGVPTLEETMIFPANIDGTNFQNKEKTLF